MFFPLSKIGFFLIQPSTLLVLAIAAGLAMIARGRTASGLRLAGGALALTVALGLLPVGNALILPLEERFPAPAASDDGKPVDGIIMLGGFEDSWVTSGRGGLATNETAERLTETVRLALRHRQARVVFTGGVSSLLRVSADASGAVARYLAEVGIDKTRIVVEGASRNTHENALYTRTLVAPKPGERWLLVTSAFHMPRSIGVFRAAGFAVIAHPVDYATRDARDVMLPLDRIPDGLRRVDIAVREWVGLVAYRASGRTDSLFPGP